MPLAFDSLGPAAIWNAYQFSNPAFDLIWYNFDMKTLAFAYICCLSISAFGVAVQELPQGEFADTEFSTNIAFVVERPSMTRIEFTVELDATQTNNVEVAIGADENNDGNLSVEESAYAFGYDCGTWFCRARDENKVETTAVDLDFQPQPHLSHTFILKSRKLDTAWNLVKVTRRGCGVSCELVKAEGRKPGFMLEVR